MYERVSMYQRDVSKKGMYRGTKSKGVEIERKNW